MERIRAVRAVIADHVAYLALDAFDDCLYRWLAVLVAWNVVNRHCTSATREQRCGREKPTNKPHNAPIPAVFQSLPGDQLGSAHCPATQ